MSPEEEQALAVEDVKRHFPLAVQRPLFAAADALRAVFPRGHFVIPWCLADKPFVVVIDSDSRVARAYASHEAQKWARGGPAEPATNAEAAVQYYMRTGRHLVDGAGKPVVDRARPFDVLLFAGLYRRN